MSRTATRPTANPSANGESHPQQSTALVPMAAMEIASGLEQIANDYRTQLEQSAVSRMVKTLVVGAAIKRLSGALTNQVMSDLIMPLMNSELGFKTDRPVWKDGKAVKPEYTIDQIRKALTVAILKGAMPFNNEFNVISGQCMLVKNYWIRAIAEFAGVDGEPVYGASVVRNAGGKQWKVRAWAWCMCDGRRVEIRGEDGKSGVEFDVSAYDGAADALIGKAERRGLRALHRLLSGRSIDDGDANDDQVDAGKPAAVPAKPVQQVSDGGRKKACDNLGKAIEACKLTGRWSEESYAAMLSQFAVKRTVDLKTEDVGKVTNLVNELAKPEPPAREPGDDDYDVPGDAPVSETEAPAAA